MKKTLDILKKGIALTFVAAIAYGCGPDKATITTEEGETGTSEAIMGNNPSGQNLSNPRPAPIGDTATTGQQANEFGELPSNTNNEERQRQQMERDRQLKENPNQAPTLTQPQPRTTSGTTGGANQ